ncbi:hypothetical protein HG535_0C01410 [Zygotorulaspora mrakii]|uniref:Elongin-C n=1 Tax=Zygotorulaspora mrakii TaxID=42260 RepID=A0A7H9B202_ZYGMR|nr:uncharacterized protein HG535_0C01410 [Zygotorulaspora mrakii]QLG71792.1 hypothetical protein HG535_0C01410 [Zygotorulaspora mrakii]
MSKIILISSQNEEVQISREAALISSTLKAMLENPFEKENPHIELHNMDTQVLKKVVEYLEYHLEYQEVDESREDISDFEIPTEMALELLLAADYLNV